MFVSFTDCGIHCSQVLKICSTLDLIQKQSQVRAFKIIRMDSVHMAKCITGFDVWMVWYSLSCFAASPLLAANIPCVVLEYLMREQCLSEFIILSEIEESSESCVLWDLAVLTYILLIVGQLS